jgi:acetyltransferase-like isoleucine patch superfamily enzyme
MSNRKIRKIALLFCLLFPNRIKLFLYRKLLRWNIGKGVRIGFTWIDTEHAIIGNDVKIGHFNIIKDLRQLEIGDSCYMLNFNFVAAGHYDWPRALRIGKGTGIMSRHFLDARGGIDIGEHADIAGRSSQIWTHEKHRGDGGLISAPVRIGSRTYVAASALIAPGVTIGESSVVALGCVVKKDTYGDRVILVGNPTQVKPRKSIELQSLGV